MIDDALSDVRVLLVEDNAYMRRILLTIMRALGFPAPLVAEDGVIGLQLFEQHAPDLVMVDWEMPNLNGAEVVRAIRKPERGTAAFTPIVMITGYSDKGRVLEAARLGVNEVITKPVSIQALAARVSSALFEERNFILTNRYFGPAPRKALFDLGDPQELPEVLQEALNDAPRQITNKDETDTFVID